MTISQRYTLFIKDGCPYCHKVLVKIEELDLTQSFTLKNKNNPVDLEELLKRGGKSQFPYLVDNEKGVEMYESGDIINYLETVQAA